MATQTRLLPTYALDRPAREAGRRGVAQARAALAEAVARNAAARLAEAPRPGGAPTADQHAAAA